MSIQAIPGAEGVVYPSRLQKTLCKALLAKGTEYRPRTHHLLPDGSPKYTNRLILEDSPYLLQHAHNPVDWHPWGDEAFARAKKENKPVFLSIGYSTCHWCHVMEEQSFESPEIAAILNRDFIAVKVDREQRPDVDATYMNAVQLLTGSGGWPLSTFLTPDGKLFYGGTYFPPAQFRQLLLQIARAWDTQRPAIEQQAGEIAEAVARMYTPQSATGEVDINVVKRAVNELASRFDSVHGGFGQAPKFPNEPWLFLLVDELWRSYDPRLLEVVTHTLDAMARGGIYDQIGGGFHRYATDAAWQVPHFEKMLYNQAQLGLIYTHVALLNNDAFYGRIARQTFDYVLREMTSPLGGFFSATDADSEGEEGKYFLWTPEQIREALPNQEAALAIEIFGVTRRGNFEGRNILHLPLSLAKFAKQKGMTVPELLPRLDRICTRLYEVRRQRIPPLRDDKVITAWNGMMIVSMAEAGRLLNEPRYLLAARRAAEYLWRQHYHEGKLVRASLHGRASGEGQQEDYAWLALAMLSLYDVTLDRSWLQKAQVLTDLMLAHFWDDEHGAFFMNRDRSGFLMVRPKETYDGAIPSGNSVAERLLAHLEHRAPQLLYLTRFHALAKALSGQLQHSPSGFGYFLTGFREFVQGETGPLQYAARGSVRIHGMANTERLQVQLRIQDGWHVNGPKTLEDLIPTHISPAEDTRGWRMGAVDYPPPERVLLPFSSQPLVLYKGKVSFSAPVKRLGRGPLPVWLQLQACDEKHCLAPDQVQLQIPGPIPFH